VIDRLLSIGLLTNLILDWIVICVGPKIHPTLGYTLSSSIQLLPTVNIDFHGKLIILMPVYYHTTTERQNNINNNNNNNMSARLE